jgi:hypothetical protein
MTSTPEQPGRATASPQQRAANAGHQTQVQMLARYAARATFGDLSAESRAQLPVHILDALACCLAALSAGRIDTGLASQIKDAVRSLEHIQVSDLMTLLARVRAGLRPPTIHGG